MNGIQSIILMAILLNVSFIHHFRITIHFSTMWKKILQQEILDSNAQDVKWFELKHYPKSDKLLKLEKEIQTLSEQLSTRSTTVETELIREQLVKTTNSMNHETAMHRFQLELRQVNVAVALKPHHLLMTKMTRSSHSTWLSFLSILWCFDRTQIER